jgi:glc operon protein GlcG
MRSFGEWPGILPADIVLCIVCHFTGIAMSTTQQPIISYGAPVSLDIARRVAAAAEAEARAHGWPMVIAVMDSAANLVVLHKMDHAQTGSVEIAQAKARSTVRFKRPTRVFEEALAAAEPAAGHRGRVPARRRTAADARGCLVGAIGVSGMQSTQDAQVAAAGAEAL